MTRGIAITLSLLVGIFLVGCDSLSGILDLFLPTTTSVRLVNNTGFTVEGTLYYSDQQDMPEAILTNDLLATELDFTLLAGANRVILTESCEDLQAIIIDDAEMLLFPGISPDADTGVLRDGDEFNCGNEIVFTFTLTPDFEIIATSR
jgi:hypothetical protein